MFNNKISNRKKLMQTIKIVKVVNKKIVQRKQDRRAYETN